jgi:hypothetical protein
MVSLHGTFSQKKKKCRCHTFPYHISSFGVSHTYLKLNVAVLLPLSTVWTTMNFFNNVERIFVGEKHFVLRDLYICQFHLTPNVSRLLPQFHSISIHVLFKVCMHVIWAVLKRCGLCFRVNSVSGADTSQISLNSVYTTRQGIQRSLFKHVVFRVVFTLSCFLFH